MPRLFVAIDLPDPVRESLANLSHGVERARWVDMAQLHLTLQFIGEVDSGTANDVEDALTMVVAPAFEMCLKGVGHFPPRKNARVLWVGVEAGPELLTLQRRIADALAEAGVEEEKRRFHPHVTIARFREPAPHFVTGPFLAAHNLYRSDPFTVEEFHLYSSVLARSGAVHHREATYELKEIAD
ncbi:MAG: RNA 2',3'-cyclic phosphodiesterase [Chitinivibrionales bacterium]|nr:RNA 2',3'-cyclic phosphodiesterase [Chitinivibrionales bacterium]